MAISSPQTSTPRTLDTQASVAWVRRFARTTPGVVGIVAVVIAAACVITGVVIGGQLDGRIAERNAILDRSEPLDVLRRRICTPRCRPPTPPQQQRSCPAGSRQRRCGRAIGRRWLTRRRHLTDATAGAADANTRSALAQISAQLSAYSRVWSSPHGRTTGRGSRSGRRTCGKRRR